MNLYRTIQANLATLKFYPNQTGSFFVLISQRWSCFFKSFLSLISLVAYLLHDANTVKEYMDSIFLTIAALTIFISFTSSVFKTSALYTFMDNAEKAGNKRVENHTESNALYVKANRQVELLSKAVYFLVVNIILPGLLLPLAILSYYRYFFTDLGKDAFVLAVPTWFPFDWENPYGYALALTLQFIMYLNPFRFIACFASFALGSYWFVRSLTKGGTDELHAMNSLAREKRPRSQIYKKITNSICGHSNLKQLIEEFVYLYEIICTSLFMGCTLLICVSMLTIHIEISHDEFDIVVLLVSTSYAYFVFFILFAACELGERLGNIGIVFDNELVQSDWYLFPMDIQKMLPMMIINTQKPFVAKCFGSVACTRRQFKKVVNASYQYFMVLRKFFK